MQLQSPLLTLTPTLDAEVLSVLAGADDWFTISQIHARLPARSREGIRRTVTRLSAQGVVDSTSVGTTTSHRLNRDHLAAGPILQLAALRSTFLERLRSDLARWRPEPVFSAVFGSAATGTMRHDSDIDLFVLAPDDVGDHWDASIDSLSERSRRWTGNALHVLVMSETEVRGALHREPVLDDIAREGLTVTGSAHAFRRLTRTAS